MAKKNKGNKNRGNSIRTLLEPMDRRQAIREARARTQLEFGEAQRALRGEIRASQQQSRNLNAWYQQYQDNMDRLRQGQLANTQALQDQMGANDSYLRGRENAVRTTLGSEADASAALRGATPSDAPISEDTAAAAQREALRTSTRDRSAQLGASAYGRLAGVNAAAELGRQADQRAERNTRLTVQSKLRDLKRDKGLARTKYLADIVQGERDYGIQRQTLKKDYGYQNAMRYVADQGLAKAQASAAATLGAAQLYSNAKIQSAKMYNAGGGKKVKGSDVLRAQDYLRAEIGSAGASWKDVRRNKTRWISQLTSRGADPLAARVAVRRYIRQAVGPRPGSAAWAAKQRQRRTGGR